MSMLICGFVDFCRNVRTLLLGCMALTEGSVSSMQALYLCAAGYLGDIGDRLIMTRYGSRGVSSLV